MKTRICLKYFVNDCSVLFCNANLNVYINFLCFWSTINKEQTKQINRNKTNLYDFMTRH